MATDDLGNQRVAFEWGNIPMQPNDVRNMSYNYGKLVGPVLPTGDSHNIEGTKWNNYPDDAWKSINYMVTAAEYLGSDVYEYTAENELEVGMSVKTTGCPGFDGIATVVYADKNKFRTLNELPGTTKKTGLRGRVDVMPTEPGLFHGKTRVVGEGAAAFTWPSVGICFNNPKAPGDTWKDLIEYLRDCGVDPTILKEATFTGGANQYDWQGGDYDDNNPGIIFWTYVDPNYIYYVDWETGYVHTGKDLDGKIAGSNKSWGQIVETDSQYIDDYWFTAFTNDPSKNNTAGWL